MPAVGLGERTLDVGAGGARVGRRDPGVRGRPFAATASRLRDGGPERPPSKVCDENPLADFLAGA